MALPTALFAMIASFALASAAVISSVDVQQGSHRDSDSKEAIAAADAGASVALLRLNRFQSRLNRADSVRRAGRRSADSRPPAGARRPPAKRSAARPTPTGSAPTGRPAANMSVVAVGDRPGDGQPPRRRQARSVEQTAKNVLRRRASDRRRTRSNSKATPTSEPTSAPTATSNGRRRSANVCGNIRHGIGKERRRHRHAVQRHEITEGEQDAAGR